MKDLLESFVVSINCISMIRSELEKRNKRIVEQYLLGEKVRFLAAVSGLTTQGIHYILDRHKVKKRKRLDKKRK